MFLDQGLSVFVPDFKREGLSATLGEGRTVGHKYITGFTS